MTQGQQYQHMVNKLLISITGGAAYYDLFVHFDLIIGMCVKITGLISFYMFVIMNHDKYQDKWKKFKMKYFKSK